MPDASHDKLSYTRGALEKIRAKYDKLSREQLLDLVCELTKTYVVDQTIPFDVPIPEREDEPREESGRHEALPDGLGAGETERAPARMADHERFAQVVMALKKRAGLPQLELFAIEESRVVLRVDNQKVTFGERTTVEFMPSQGRPRRPSGERPAPALDAPATPGAPAAPAAQAPASPGPATVETLPGARPGLPGGDGRTRQGSSAPFGAPPAPAAARGGPGVPRPATRPPEPPQKPKPPEKDKAEDSSDVGHIVERFKRLDLD